VQLVHRLWLNLRRDPSIQDLHHSDIITYALTRLAGQYARDKQEIIQDLRGYKSADTPISLHPISPDPSLSAVASSAGIAGNTSVKARHRESDK
jgi:hypothetical protein